MLAYMILSYDVRFLKTKQVSLISFQTCNLKKITHPGWENMSLSSVHNLELIRQQRLLHRWRDLGLS